MKILPVSFTGTSRPLNNTANLYSPSLIVRENSGDTFIKRENSAPVNRKSMVTPESEKTCKRIVNATSLVCGGISGAAGKAEPFSPSESGTGAGQPGE